MGEILTRTTFREAETPQELIDRFAQIMKERYGARLYLFGSRAAGGAGAYSDFDFVAVADSFKDSRPTARALDRLTLWLEAGGWGEALDLHCYTPEEFARELDSGMGYLAGAARRSELIEVSPTPDANRPGLEPQG